MTGTPYLRHRQSNSGKLYRDDDWTCWRLVLMAASLLFAALISSAPAAAAGWPIKSFEVVPVNGPDPSAWSKQKLADFFLPFVSDKGIAGSLKYVPDTPKKKDQLKDLVAEIENTLARSAAILEVSGFRAPAIEPVVTGKEGKPAYRVFLVKGLKKAAGQYHADPCDRLFGRERVILLDLDDVQSNLSLTPHGTQTVAHELFHAVQYNSPFFQGCGTGRVGSWITEGTAKAVGWIVAGQLRPGTVGGILKEPTSFEEGARAEIWGLRNYRQRHPVPYDPALDVPPHIAYATNSFWTYLAEYYAMSGRPSTPGMNPHNLKYLAQMLESPPAPRDCNHPKAKCQGEMAWLDTQLRSIFGRPLRNIYAKFGQAYALYGEWRPKSVAKFDLDWLKRAFAPGGCKIVPLGPGAENLQVELDIARFEPQSMLCWELQPMGFKKTKIPVATTVEMRSGAQRPTLLQLTSVIADGSRRMKKARLESAPGDRQRVRWEYDIKILKSGKNAQGTLFLLTNVADAAEFTAAYEGKNNTGLTLTFTALQEYASMGASSVDGAKLADAINTPLPIEMIKYGARVYHGQKEKMNGTFVGKGYSEGIVNPCVLNIFGWAKRSPGKHFAEGIQIHLQTSGPITPDSYPIVDTGEFKGSYKDRMPVGQTVASAGLYDMPENQNDLKFINGWLKIVSVSAGLIRGHISGIAVHREYSTETGKKEVTETRSLGARFSIRARGALGFGRRERAYPCLRTEK